MISTEHNTLSVIQATLSDRNPELDSAKLRLRADIIYADTTLLVRCAMSRCLISYAKVIALRGHGNPQNGQWLDDIYACAVVPFEFPDLTMLVVNKATLLPSPQAFEARRAAFNQPPIDDIPSEQKRCFWFQAYAEFFDDLSPIPPAFQAARIMTPQPDKEREINRATNNAMQRILSEGVETKSVGKAYPNSLERAELTALVSELWAQQNGRCALTGVFFDLRDDTAGGISYDRVSLDRIDNAIGYARGNVQLTTQFANRARGTLSVEAARERFVQFQ